MASPKVVYSPEFLAEDRSGRVIATGVVFFVLEVFFFGAYFTSRIRSKTAKHLETLFMVLAFIFCIALVIQLFCKPTLYL
jgi:hypothetical protein